MQSQRNTARAGFSLIEVVVAVAVMAILAAVLVPRLANTQEKAKFSRAVSELRAFRTAVENVYLDVGAFPSNRNRGEDPGLVDRNRVPSSERDKWQGPYLDRWPETGHPWGGDFDYEYGRHNGFNFDGNAGNEVWIEITRGNLDREIMDEIDERLDDGNRNDGIVRHNNNNTLEYFIGEGPDW